jgi:sodium-dependent phosphate cotransporter
VTPNTTPDGIAAHPLFQNAFAKFAAVLGLLFVFLMGVNGLGDGFKSLGSALLDSFFSATSNPFIGLMVGILATTIVQSSSVSTSLIVGLVAAPDNPLPVANAVPMMANIGTTVTNTIVSLGHVGRREEFRRAFAVATCHDFFNFITVAVLLPLELMTGYLRRMAESIAAMVTGLGGVTYESPIKGALKAALGPIKTLLTFLTESKQWQGVFLILISGILIFISLFLLVRVMRSAMQSRVESLVSRGLEQPALISMSVGVVVTVMVQSSSITTSLLVPLAGAGIVTLAQAFPITIGANIGTTVTALLAALAATGENAVAGVTIALVHLLFNMSGTLLVYPVKRVRQIPIRGAEWLAGVAVESPRYAVGYVLMLFYAVPAIFALLNRFF